MTIEYCWPTKIGMVRLRSEKKAEWYIYLKDREWQGPFPYPDTAIDYLTMGDGLKYPSWVAATGRSTDLELPEKLSGWDRIRV
jgi:hypothetical protein